MTNSQSSLWNGSWLVRFSTHASGFSRSNLQAIHEFQIVPSPFIFSSLRKIQEKSFHIFRHTTCSFILLIKIRNKTTRSWSPLKSPTLEYNQDPSTKLPHYSPTFPTLPSHYPHTHFPRSQLRTLSTFPPSQLINLTPFPAHHPPKHV